MMMRRRNRGFKLGRKIIRIFKWVTRYTRPKYEKLGGSKMQRSKTLSKLCDWVRKFKRELKKPGLGSARGYVRVGHEQVMDNKTGRVPKGHLALYVGEPDGDTWPVLVPVLFVNHPLFKKLLKEAESVYGFDHPGRITIPCPISEFENVKTRIAATDTKCRWRSGLSPTCIPNFDCLSA